MNMVGAKYSSFEALDPLDLIAESRQERWGFIS